MWRADATDAGRFYLEHGRHPEHPDYMLTARVPARVRRQRAADTGSPDSGAATAPIAGRAAPTGSGPAPTASIKSARELIDRLQREDGTIRVESPDDATRALYRRLIHAAKQHDLVPDGYHLRHTGRDAGDVLIRLYPDAEPDGTDWNRIRLNARRDTTDPALVFPALDADPANLNVSPQALPRALQLIRLLADEAAKRGHRVGVNTKTKHPRVYLQIGSHRRAVNLTEEYDQIRHVLTDDELQDLHRRPWIKPPEVDTIASGRLRLEIARGGYNSGDTWVDAKGNLLEQQLRRIIRDVEITAEADEQARLARLRVQEQAEAERKRRDEHRLAQWQAAMADARGQAIGWLRAQTFQRAFQAWTTATNIRAFCAALDEAADRDDVDSSTGVADWVAWGRAAADDIDPTRGTRPLAAVDFDPEPGPNDLRPFLAEWSPHRPEREYRSQHDEQALADVREQAHSWHHGLLDDHTW